MKKTEAPGYAELVRQVVRTTPTLLTSEEITQRVAALRPIETRSPSATIRGIITLCRLIARGGAAGYGWYPRMINGARVRITLFAEEFDRQFVGLDDLAKDLLCPSFFADQSLKQGEPITLTLPNGERIHPTLILQHVGQGDWGTEGTPEFWRRLTQHQPQSGDSLILTCVDGEAREYRVEYEATAASDEATLRARMWAVTQAAREHLWRNRAHATAPWDLAQHLLASGQYHHAVPPAPYSQIWNRVAGEGTMFEAAAETPPRKTAAARQAYQLHVQLQGIHPPIWRRIVVTDTRTLAQLHWIIQLAIGWTNSHLHQFTIEGVHYSDPSFELDEDFDDWKDANALTLGKLTKRAGRQFSYEYDFGDSWRHDIMVEAITPIMKGEAPLRCLAGERACPPEDCGGIGGYELLKTELRDLTHLECNSWLLWLGGGFDAEGFDVAGADWLLSKLVSVFAQKPPTQKKGWYR